MSAPSLQQLAASALAAALSLAAARREASAAPRLEEALACLSPLSTKQARRRHGVDGAGAVHPAEAHGWQFAPPRCNR
jgi:hypothetical protein